MKTLQRDLERTLALYHAMPGAPPIPIELQGKQAVCDLANNAHWDFCAAIVAVIDDAITTRLGGARQT